MCTGIAQVHADTWHRSMHIHVANVLLNTQSITLYMLNWSTKAIRVSLTAHDVFTIQATDGDGLNSVRQCGVPVQI